jgi:hypothetical protein
MNRNVLETIQGIEIFPLISLVIFFTFFMLLLVWVVRMRKSDIEEISRMPLEDDDQFNAISTVDSHTKGV